MAVARRRIIKPTSEDPESVTGVRCKVVKWVVLPVLQSIIIFTPILPQRFNTSVAPIGVNPRSTEHPPHDIDAVENVRLRYDYCLNAKRC
jgi:hypothetical protein